MGSFRSTRAMGRASGLRARCGSSQRGRPSGLVGAGGIMDRPGIVAGAGRRGATGRLCWFRTRCLTPDRPEPSRAHRTKLASSAPIGAHGPSVAARRAGL